MTGYPFCCQIQIRYSDVDAMNHVNNAVYVTYLELARTLLWRERIGYSGSAREFDFILARVAVDFRSPIDFNDSVEIGVACTSIGRTSFTLGYRIEASGRLAAEAESVQVCYDYAAGRPVRAPEELRHKLEALRQ
ncbi:MAG: thioesterase family protein [Acidobacteriota bacterium]